METIINVIIPVITGIAGWFAARRKKNNDFLHDLQQSVNMLTDRNRELLNELIELRKQNARLLGNQEEMHVKIEKLQKENIGLKKELEELNKKLENVKTITRKA